MKKIENIEQALAFIRAEKNTPGTLSHRMYKLFETAHPNVLAIIELHAAQSILAGSTVGKTIADSAKTKEGREQLERLVNNSKMNSVKNNITDPSNDDSK